MRFSTVAGTIALFCLTSANSRTAETDTDKQAVKTALQNFQEYIGAWNGNGESKTGKSEFWKETMNWAWKFAKDGNSWLQVEFKDDKTFDKGEMKFLPDKKKYQLTLTGKDKKDQIFLGEIKQKRVVFTRVDDKSSDKFTLTMFTTNDGALFKMEYTVQSGGKGIDKKLFEVNHKKEGVSLSGGKKNECIVSGGAGTIPVTFGGKTYYVCCGGCRDAFNENPKKFVDEFEKKNK
jgi:hypothetical protein